VEAAEAVAVVARARAEVVKEEEAVEVEGWAAAVAAAAVVARVRAEVVKEEEAVEVEG
jgi:hypothetical protein